MKILLVAGTRPNFIKIAPLFHNLKNQDWCEVKICHTGQHYDKNMSDIFWEYFSLPEPDYFLGVSGGNVPQIIGHTTVAISELLQKEEPKFDLVVVFGDVNATVAASIAAVQLGIKLMHVEAGLRSFDRQMPEEINRILTDHIADFLMVSEPSGLENLKNEGISEDKISYVGNIMIESLLNTQSKWENTKFSNDLENIINENYILSTFHRPENVDTEKALNLVVNRLEELTSIANVVFPIHPRTLSRLKKWGLLDRIVQNTKIIDLPPQGYFEFIKLISKSTLVVTDSGGIQEETSFLNIPCITLRKNTERPVTIEKGTNKLMSISGSDFLAEVKEHYNLLAKKTNSKIEKWDKSVSDRIINTIKYNFLKS